MDAETQEQLGRARVNQAATLTRLGKLALAEQELRNALRLSERLSPRLQARALLALASIHADQGDYFLSEMEADRAGLSNLRSRIVRLAGRTGTLFARQGAARPRAARPCDRTLPRGREVLRSVR